MKHNCSKVLSIVCFLFGMMALGLLVMDLKPYLVTKQVSDRVIKKAVKEEEQETPEPERVIDFDYLKGVNKDIIGWIYIPKIGVDYPVLSGESYLSRDMEGNYSQNGAIFTWNECDSDLDSKHCCIFGHNLITGQMFGNLKKLEKGDECILYTPKSTYKLEVVSLENLSVDDSVFGKGYLSDIKTVHLITCTDWSDYNLRTVITCKEKSQ